MYHFKVDNPKLSNEIPQMRSEHLQPRVYDFSNRPKQTVQNINKSSKIKIANLRK